MGEMHSQERGAPPLHVVFEAAKSFGLTDEEVWREANEALAASDGDSHAAGYLDELAGALARRVISKQRAIIAAQRGVRLADEPPPYDEGS
jgi:hypothetical protein